jgi:carbonic anhydrase/acetyltransferase-like protein (isoleucine patch superfamily)
MTADSAARIITLPDRPGPVVADTAYVAPGAVLVGHVILAEHSSVWYNAVLRAEAEPIRIGSGSNLQDNVSCHVDHGFPLIVGRDVSVGHGAVLHGCTVEDGSLIGMAATILNGAVIGAGSLVAAGAVVLEGTVVPPHSLVAGVPAKVRRQLTDDEVTGIRHNAQEYLRHSALHASVQSPAAD